MIQKIAVMTGATGGIGKVVCKHLIANGYTVFAACRNAEKGEQLRREIFGNNSAESEVDTAFNRLVFIQLNLKSFDSVKVFCAKIIESLNNNSIISLLINNAGVISPVYEVTQDGYESTMQVNYLSGRLITETLLPYINGKIINTVSCTISVGSYKEPIKEISVPNKALSTFKSLKIYSNSKFMLAHYTVELHRRLCNGIDFNGNIKSINDVKVYGIDPGIVNTGIITMHRWYDPLANIFFRPFIKTAAQGAQPLIHAIEYNASEMQSGNCTTPFTSGSGPLLFIGKRIKSFPKTLRSKKQ